VDESFRNTSLRRISMSARIAHGEPASKPNLERALEAGFLHHNLLS